MFRTKAGWFVTTTTVLWVAGCAPASIGTSHDASRDGSDTGASGDPCAAATTCSDCAAMQNCGWCGSSGQCLSGDTNGSSDGTCSGSAWGFVGDFCGTQGGDSGTPPVDSGTPPPIDAGHDAGSTGCVPTVPPRGENTNALCSDGIDNDCNGYIDCNDFNCSRNPAVTVCSTTHDAGTPPPTDSGPPPPVDAGPPGAVGAMGGTVDLLHFGIFGDVRPPSNNDTTNYPTAVITTIMQNMQSLSAQFAIGSGDYMFASSGSAVSSQVSMFLGAEGSFHNHIFHAMGNHECNGSVTSNCPLGNEYPNIIAFLSQLAPGYGHPYYDWVVHTRLGDAHFIATAPNAWNTAQQTWLQSALAQRATYTFVIEHEPPTAMGPPAGCATIESLIASRAGGVTLRLYGHTHEYEHISSTAYNAVVDGNAGAPFDGFSIAGQYYGFGIVDQRADGNIVFTAYHSGSPPMVHDTWVVTPAGAATH